jgi:hypothetical protein
VWFLRGMPSHWRPVTRPSRSNPLRESELPVANSIPSTPAFSIYRRDAGAAFRRPMVVPWAYSRQL